MIHIVTINLNVPGLPFRRPKRNFMVMFGIKISFSVVLLLVVFRANSQSCSLSCVSTECGFLNVAFEPNGGPEFCEGFPITLTNTSTPGFQYFVINWSDGVIDTLFNYNTVVHYYSIADSNLCDGNVPFEICFKGVLECGADSMSCASGSYDFGLLVRPKAIIAMPFQHCIESPVQFTHASCNATSYL